VLSCSSPANQLLLLSSVEIFGNSFLYPEAFFFFACNLLCAIGYTAVLELLKTLLAKMMICSILCQIPLVLMLVCKAHPLRSYSIWLANGY
jgi:hypothetical protein